jgi:hypothetical protein
MADDQVAFIIADLDLFTRGEVVALMLNIDANLRENPPLGTPVDTGWASANWLPSVGKPMIVDSDKAEPTPADIAQRAQMAEQGRNAVLAWKPADGALFSTNSVPYIEPLNAGHSPQQATPGFVGRAIEQAIKETYSAGANKAARGRRAAAGRASKARPK